MALNQSAWNFGQNYAILNLDLMTILIDSINGTTEGDSFIANCSLWNDAVHQKDPQPLTMFTTLYFSNSDQPELSKNQSPFTELIDSFGTFVERSPEVQIDANFPTSHKDIILQKTRWYAGSGNNLERILRAQSIDTVVISGLSLAGVVMSTVYRLFDLDYNIFVISDNVLQIPVSQNAQFLQVILDTLLPSMNLKVITLCEALEALKRS